MSIPLLAPGVDVVYGPPALLIDPGCGRCGELRCVAVADVSWTIAGPSEVRDGAIVGRACIADMVASALDEAAEGTQVSVDLPVWTSTALVEAAGLSDRQLIHWHGRGWIRPEPRMRDTPGFPLQFLADEVDHARRMVVLVDQGWRPHAADNLLRRHPAAAFAVEQALVAVEPVAVPA